jgi:hypothetical protein
MIVNNDNRLSLLVVEEIVRTRVLQFIQDILEEEGADLLRRRKSERGLAVDGFQGYRNGHGNSPLGAVPSHSVGRGCVILKKGLSVQYFHFLSDGLKMWATFFRSHTFTVLPKLN